MYYGRAHTTLGEKVVTVIGCLLLGVALFLGVIAYQLTV